jgi:hypothetical protein
VIVGIRTWFVVVLKYAALTVLGNLRTELETPIPLAWTPGDVSPVAAIEVYPAAALVAHRIRSTGYKKRDQTEERREIIAALRTKLTIGKSVPDLATSADLVDAAVACWREMISSQVRQ